MGGVGTIVEDLFYDVGQTVMTLIQFPKYHNIYTF